MLKSNHEFRDFRQHACTYNWFLPTIGSGMLVTINHHELRIFTPFNTTSEGCLVFDDTSQLRSWDPVNGSRQIKAIPTYDIGSTIQKFVDNVIKNLKPYQEVYRRSN